MKKMRKLLELCGLIILSFFVSFTTAFAQFTTVTGRITYDFFETNPTDGLDLDNPITRPSRGIFIQAIDSNDANRILGTAITDVDGNYSVDVVVGERIFIVANAEMLRPQRLSANPQQSGWWYQVVDNTNQGALYTMASTSFETTVNPHNMNLHAKSGWDPTAKKFTGLRVAAPFSIIDAVFSANDYFANDFPATTELETKFNWSKKNISHGNNSASDKAIGRINTSHYDPGTKELYILGDSNGDIDEYDHSVIVHEWVHFLDGAISRSDSIGWNHSNSNQLDVRVAFSEGWGNALSGIVLNNEFYTDVKGKKIATGGYEYGIYLREPLERNTGVGAYSEEAVASIIYDLLDSRNAADHDFVQIGASSLLKVLSAQMKEGESFRTLIKLLTSIVNEDPAQSDGIMDLITRHAYHEVDGFGEYSMDTAFELKSAISGGHLTNDSFKTPIKIYDTLLTGPAGVETCVTNLFGRYNKFLNRRFFRLNIDTDKTYDVRARRIGASGRPVINIFLKGKSLWTGGGGAMAEISETLAPGVYILEVSDADILRRDLSGTVGGTFERCLRVSVQ